MNKNYCPRCKKYYKEYPALSIKKRVYICQTCSIHEAFEILGLEFSLKNIERARQWVAERVDISKKHF